MKKTMFFCLLCVLLLGFSIGVSADAALYTDEDVTVKACDYDAYVSTVDGGVNLREEPTTKAPVIVTIPDFYSLHIESESSNGWGYTSYQGAHGWVALNQLSKSYPIKSVSMTVRVTASDGVNLREGPYTSYSKLRSAAIPAGEVLTVTGISKNNWGQVTYEGVTGWIALSQVNEVKGNGYVEPTEPEPEVEIDEEETEPEETVTDDVTADSVQPAEKESVFPFVALIVGLVLVIIALTAVVVVLIVTKKK